MIATATTETRIHPTAIIDSSAHIGTNVSIGPYSIIGPDVVVGDDCIINAHVVIEGHTKLGQGCQIHSGSVLGGTPQDMNFKGEKSFVEIGDRTILREFTTVHRASGEGDVTRVGSDCMLMAYSHLAHNCQLQNHVIIANSTQLAGYVQVGDWAFISGGVMVHQFVRIGKMAIIGGASATRQDIPPFALSDGQPATIMGINKVGLRRRGLNLEQRSNIKKAFYYLWYSNLNTSQAIETIQTELIMDEYIQELLTFVQTSKRGIHRPQAQVAPRFVPKESHDIMEDSLNLN